MRRKRFGQHFLEPAWVDKVVAAIAPQPSDTFLEIGAGRGALTLPLAARAKAVVAFEIDRDLAAKLQQLAPSNLHVIAKDFLDAAATLTDLPGSPHPPSYRVAGNLPYNVASPILFKLSDLFAAGHQFSDVTVMLQQEVVDRLMANPGGRIYGVLSVLMQRVARIDPLLTLPPGAFRPVPKIRSALIRMRFHVPDPAVSDESLLSLIVQAVFTRRRKTLANALMALDHFQQANASVRVPQVRPKEALARAGIEPTRRPETLTLQEFANLTEVYASVSL